jgi:lysophospholipase L1-like esterase
MLRRTTVALALLTALLAPIVAATVRPAAPVSGQSASDKVTYIALGDSIASGHGLGDEEGIPSRRADPDKERCRQSSPKAGDSRKAYPYYVAEHLERSGYEVDFDWRRHLACSGATAFDQTDPELTKHKSLSAQVDDALIQIQAIDPSEPILVSITIGANDFGFADACNLVLWLLAADQSDFESWASLTATVVRLQLKKEINRLLNESPNVSVVASEVYNPFNRDSIFFNRAVGLRQNWNCGSFPDEYPSGMYERTQYAIGALNNNIHTAVYDDVAQPDRATVTTGLADAFLDHAAPKDVWSLAGQCGGDPGGLTMSTTSTTWIQYPGDPTSNSYSLPNAYPVFWNATGDCFHPNEKGARAIAAKVAITAYDVIYEPAPPPPGEAGAWPSDRDDAPGGLYVWLGANMYGYPDWVACDAAATYCLVGYSGGEHMLVRMDGLVVIGTVEDSAPDPRRELLAFGLSDKIVSQILGQ